jgi:hypothetical protein
MIYFLVSILFFCTTDALGIEHKPIEVKKISMEESVSQWRKLVKEREVFRDSLEGRDPKRRQEALVERRNLENALYALEKKHIDDPTFYEETLFKQASESSSDVLKKMVLQEKFHATPLYTLREQLHDYLKFSNLGSDFAGKVLRNLSEDISQRAEPVLTDLEIRALESLAQKNLTPPHLDIERHVENVLLIKSILEMPDVRFPDTHNPEILISLIQEFNKPENISYWNRLLSKAIAVGGKYIKKENVLNQRITPLHFSAPEAQFKKKIIVQRSPLNSELGVKEFVIRREFPEKRVPISWFDKAKISTRLAWADILDFLGKNEKSQALRNQLDIMLHEVGDVSGIIRNDRARIKFLDNVSKRIELLDTFLKKIGDLNDQRRLSSKVIQKYVLDIYKDIIESRAEHYNEQALNINNQELAVQIEKFAQRVFEAQRILHEKFGVSEITLKALVKRVQAPEMLARSLQEIAYKKMNKEPDVEKILAPLELAVSMIDDLSVATNWPIWSENNFWQTVSRDVEKITDDVKKRNVQDQLEKLQDVRKRLGFK